MALGWSCPVSARLIGWLFLRLVHVKLAEPRKGIPMKRKAEPDGAKLRRREGWACVSFLLLARPACHAAGTEDTGAWVLAEVPWRKTFSISV